MTKVAVVAAKEKSSRVPGKNFRDFDSGRSLVEIKIQQLKDANVFDQIFLSSDSPLAVEIASRLGVSFVDRGPGLADESTPWHLVVTGVLSSLNLDDESTLIAWCPATSPLFSDFGTVLSKFETLDREVGCDSIYTTNAVKQFLISEAGQPLNFQFGPWHRYTQSIDGINILNNAMYVGRLGTFLANQYLIGVNPAQHSISSIEGWDIDTETEFEIAQILYARKWGIR